MTLVSYLLQFHSLAPMYYRGSAAAVIVYDITKLVSLLSSQQVLLPVFLTLVGTRGLMEQKHIFTACAFPAAEPVVLLSPRTLSRH